MAETQTTTTSAVVQPEKTEPEAPAVIPVDVDKIYTKEELSIHNKDGDLWIAIDGTVYDLTKFSEEHPGGKKSTSQTIPNTSNDNS